MKSTTLDGIVLREVLYNDSDKILTVLTAEKGIITVAAKGVKNIKSKNSSAVQLFCYSELELAETGNQYVLRTAYLKNAFFGIRDDIDRYSLACYISETASYFCTSGSDESELMRLILNTFYALANFMEKPLWLIKAAYELKLCCVCGFSPQFDVCSACLRKTDEIKTENYYFSFSDGDAVCAECAKKSDSVSTLYKTSTAVFFAAKYISESKISRFLSFFVNGGDIISLCDLCEKYLLYTAERSFETLKFYKSLNSTNIT